jgi:hypothetical protein
MRDQQSPEPSRSMLIVASIPACCEAPLGPSLRRSACGAALEKESPNALRE